MDARERVIILVDMDCFYCQVEEKLDPQLKGKPVAVVQYNAWKGGGLIAVNYEAKAKGVTRHMRGDEAKAKCPNIELVRVPTVREKADLTRYRDAGKQVAEVLQTFTPLLERASVDEAYLDITSQVNDKISSFYSITPDQLKNSHIVGFECVADFLKEIASDECLNDNNVKLAIGGVIAEEIRAAVYEKTGYRCSAGVAHNKILAKLTCGLHKPNQQTVLPHESIPKLYENLSVKKIKSLGGKFGDLVTQKLNITNMGELIHFSEKDLQSHFEEKTAKWLFNIARGIDLEPVTVRLISKSIGCCKKFPGRGALTTEESVRHWMQELSIEIAERIEKDIAENNRKPKQLVVNYSQQIGRRDVASSRSCPLNSTDQEKIYQDAYEVVRKNCRKTDGSFCIKFLGLNVGKFEDTKNANDIISYFINAKARKSNESSTASSVNNFKDNQKLTISKSNDTVKENTSVTENVSTALIKDKNNANSDDSNEELEAIYNSAIASDESETKIKNSFFHNFFKRWEPSKRDFDTSVALLELDDDSNESKNDEQTTDQNVTTENPIFTNPSIQNKSETQPSRLHMITDDNKELCTECNKYIPVEDIVSHMDYHFAIKIVREEAHLYKNAAPSANNSSPQINNKQIENEKKSKITRKRKSGQANLQDITAFFNTIEADDNLEEENSQICSECSKRIKLDEYVDHMDFHIAKKLHREINSLPQSKDFKESCNENVKSLNSACRSSKKCDITTYFRKV